MEYIQRRIIIYEGETQTEVLDFDFLSLDTPLILLGEPGAGKSEIVDHYHLLNLNSSLLYPATTLLALPPISEDNAYKKIIIDGVDEISAYRRGLSITEEILRKIPLSKKPNFILTCRAADWQYSAASVIENIYGVHPTIGYIVPFTEQNIIDFCNFHNVNGEQFLSEAHNHGILDLLSNPNTLLLFLQGTINNKWPINKYDLFKNACDNLVKETRKTHGEQKKNIPIAALLDAAGFICTQLLLADKAGIAIEDSSKVAPCISEILSESSYNPEIINYALSTRIFKLKPNNILVPCHRTVAEYLSAHWLSKALSTKKVSFNRLRTIFYSNNSTIPSAFRGLHAWLVSINDHFRKNSIKKDPYGLLKYGDCSNFSINEKTILFDAIKETADTDPYFRGFDNLTVGKELIIPELRDEIFRILQDSNAPFQLKDLFMDAMSHAGNLAFVETSRSDLLMIIFNSHANLKNRNTAANLLLSTVIPDDWIEIAYKLSRKRDFNSKRLILNIVKHKPNLFASNFISKIFISITDEATIGVGYFTLNQLSLEQIEECLSDFVKFLLLNKKNKVNKPTTKLRRRVKVLIQEFLLLYIKKFQNPSVTLTWACIRCFKSPSATESRRQVESIIVGSQNFRRLIQKESLHTTSTKSSNLIFFNHHWLWSNEDDLIYNLEYLSNSQLPHKYSLWASLVNWIFANTWLEGKAKELAYKQSQVDQNLGIEFDIIQTHRTKSQKELETHQLQLDERKNNVIKARHLSYLDKIDTIEAGTNVEDLKQIACAYLGVFTDIKGDTPKSRVEDLIGVNLYERISNGIISLVENFDIPSVNEIILADVIYAEKKFKYLLICYVDLCLVRGKKLEAIHKDILASTLAAFRWGEGISLKLNIPNLYVQLKNFLFEDSNFKELFLIETLEPYICNNSNYIPGIYSLAEELEYFSIMGKLAIDWITQYPKLNSQILSSLLEIAICKGNHAHLVSIIKEKLLSINTNDYLEPIWVGIGFLLNFDNLNQINITKDYIWIISDWMWGSRRFEVYWPKPTIYQLHYFITKFAPFWPLVYAPTGVLINGNNNVWDASKYIRGAITEISRIPTPEAADSLLNLINNPTLIEYSDALKHAYSENIRMDRTSLSMEEVRSILLSTAPQSHEDLQALVIDTIQILQDKILHGQTSDYRVFWEPIDKHNPIHIPYNENHCRDRIVSLLEVLFEPYGISVQTEGTRSNDKRCDFLVISGQITIPVEIKGQWHKDVYTAASSQLQDYTQEPRADGFGLYIVLWFGNCKKQPLTYQGNIPSTLDEMTEILKISYKNIPEKTQWILMDLSKRDNKIKKK